MFSPKPCEDIVNKDIIFMIILDVSTSIAYLLRKVYTSSAAFLRSATEDISVHVFATVPDGKDDVSNT